MTRRGRGGQVVGTLMKTILSEGMPIARPVTKGATTPDPCGWDVREHRPAPGLCFRCNRRQARWLTVYGRLCGVCRRYFNSAKSEPSRGAAR
jgi:hypothetical protein